jgi:hypothetical protein
MQDRAQCIYCAKIPQQKNQTPFLSDLFSTQQHHKGDIIEKESKKETLYELSWTAAFLAEAPRGLEAARSFFCCWESLTAEARATAAARRSAR